MADNQLEREAFAALIEKFNERACGFWNEGDLEAFCAGYHPNALYITARGMVEGREAILEAYREEFPTREKLGYITTRLVRLLLPSDGVQIHDTPTEALHIDTIAVAVVEFYVEFGNDQTHKGLSVLTFGRDPNDEIGISIVTDTSP